MNRICPRCRKVYSYSLKECPNGCAKKTRSESNRIYDKCQRENQGFYNSKEWKRLRESCRNKFSELCLWSLYKHKRVKKGSLVHHIVPLSEDKSKGLSLSNLVYLCDEAHREIHRLYKTDQIKTIKEIKEFIKIWKVEYGGGGI
ncbi:HNH endonuclease [Cetobacterium sp.]|uniref:HNH endonuclease n=1 Tax=Cetobacterium sp. TaxID=2071632 RepID=UPI003F323B24